MTFYDDMQNVASELLADFKQGTIRYIHVTPGDGPVDNPGAPVETAYTLNATARGAKFKYVNMGLAVASDLQVTMAIHPSITPVINGFVEIDGTRYKIVQVLPKPAAGTVAAFTLIVRK